MNITLPVLALTIVFSFGVGWWLADLMLQVERRSPSGRRLARLNAWARRELRGIKPNPFPPDLVA